MHEVSVLEMIHPETSSTGEGNWKAGGQGQRNKCHFIFVSSEFLNYRVCYLIQIDGYNYSSFLKLDKVFAVFPSTWALALWEKPYRFSWRTGGNGQPSAVTHCSHEPKSNHHSSRSLSLFIWKIGTVVSLLQDFDDESVK